jgi:hypothetical protein
MNLWRRGTRSQGYAAAGRGPQQVAQRLPRHMHRVLRRVHRVVRMEGEGLITPPGVQRDGLNRGET